MRIEHYSESGVEVYYTGTLEENKQEAMQQIKMEFEGSFVNGSFISSLGFRVDNRRSGIKNDLENIRGMIDVGILFFKDYDGNTHQLTLSEMNTIKIEMINDGMMKYQNKWSKEEKINLCTTIESIWL